MEMSNSGLAVKNGEVTVPLLMYTDDIMVLGNTHSKTQELLDILSSWCKTCGMKANIKKSQVVQNRNKQRPRNTMPLQPLWQPMNYEENDNYLGCWVNEYGNESQKVESLTGSAGRSFSRMVGLFKQLGDLGYVTHCKLYESYVLLVTCYVTAVTAVLCITQHPGYYRTV